jgi:hypothetical protein
VKQRGRPIRGAIAGLFFGLFLALDLVIFGVVAIDSNLLAVLPVLGLGGGIALGLMAPLHRRSTGAAGDTGDRPTVVAKPEPGPNPA